METQESVENAARTKQGLEHTGLTVAPRLLNQICCFVRRP